MNAGIQDSYNLAWKLALVIQGKADKKLFETYHDERLENAKNLLKTTDRMFEIAAGSGWFLSFLRMKVLPCVAKYFFCLDSFKRFIFPLLSQIGINYRDSDLSLHGKKQHFKIKPGDRMPYFLLDGDSIYNKLRQPKFHFLVFASAKDKIQTLKTELKGNYAQLVDFEVIQFCPKIAKIFGSKKSFSLLLRPDNYIGFISSEISWKEVNVYLAHILT